LNIPPVTFLAILSQVAVYLQFLVVPRLCLSGEAVWLRGEYLRLLVPAVRHTHDIHLYYNMVSLAWKGLNLERRLGSVRFLLTLVALTLMSSVAYVGLAVLAADLSDDYSYMQQCAIGFSGVLFALKVVNSCNYSQIGERESFFGFLLPVKYAVWIELIVIQVMVPKASFLGHLGGILAGLVFAKGPLGGISSLLRTSAFSLVPLRLGTILVGAGVLAGHLGLIFDHPLTGCVPTQSLHLSSWRQGLSLAGTQQLLLAPLHHLGHLHLAINLFSFIVKGRRLEGKLGFRRFLLQTGLSLVGTSFMFWAINRVVYEVTGTLDHMYNCNVGLSGPLFALKVLAVLHSDRMDLTVVFEAVELTVLMEKNNRFYHVAGLVAGFILYMWQPGNRYHRWTNRGRRLGDSPNSSFGEESRTRSWGYGGGRGHTTHEESEINEAINRSRQSYYEEQHLHHPPSAPPLEDEEPFLYEPASAAGGSASAAGGWRLPPQHPGGGEGMPPPPPGGGVTIDELRRRRLNRFS